jgi:hypothetical protein
MRHSAESIFAVKYLCEFESICKTVLALESGTQGYSLTKRTEGRKSRETVPLICITVYTGKFLCISGNVEPDHKGKFLYISENVEPGPT